MAVNLEQKLRTANQTVQLLRGEIDCLTSEKCKLESELIALGWANETPENPHNPTEIPNTCSNCKYWESNISDGECDFINTITADKAEGEGMGIKIEAYAQDDSGLEVQLLTGPKFFMHTS